MSDSPQFHAQQPHPPTEEGGRPTNNSEQLQNQLQELVAELQAHQLELEMQQLELVRTRDLLQKQYDKYHDLYQHAPSALISLDSEGNILDFNRAAATLLGASDKENNKRIHGYISPESIDAFSRFFAQAQITNQEYHAEIQLLDNRQNTLHTQFAIAPDWHPDSESLFWRCTITDISPIVLLNKQLENERAKKESILSNLAEGVAVIDLHSGAIVFVNQSLCQLYNLQKWQLLGQSYHLLVRSDYATQLNSLFALANEQPQVLPWVPCLRAQHGEFYAELRYSAMLFDGTPCYLVSITDITQRHLTNVALAESRKMLNTVFDLLEVGITITDSLGNIIDCNKSSERILGITKTQHLSRNYADATWRIIRPDHSEMPAEEYASVRALKNNCTVRNVVMGILRPDKRISWINVDATPLGIPGLGVVITYIDITETVTAHEQLRESEERWKFALEGARDGVWDWNLETNQVYFSPQWKMMLGYQDHELRNEFQTWRNLQHPDDLPHSEEAVQGYLGGRLAELSVLHRLRCPNGQYRWILSRGHISKRDQHGRPLRMIGTHTDLTEHIEMKNQLLKLNADKDRFMQILAHDLRGPFNSLLGLSELLLHRSNEYSSERTHELLQIMNDSHLRTYNLLEDLLLWAKSQSGNLPFQPQPLAFRDIAEQCMQSVQIQAQSKSVVLHLVPTHFVCVYADRDMLLTVLRNLLSNAIKFSFPGGVVRIAAQIHQQQVYISVADNGTGMKPEVEEKLWSILQPNSQIGTGGERGTGYGLLLCKEFVEKNGGKIWVQSLPGQGSTFYFSLPGYDSPAMITPSETIN